MTVYGYARVSTDGQTLAAQEGELTAAGAAKVYAEKVSGAVTDRAELGRVLKRLQPGDTLIVTRLDRLARSTRDLLNILDTVAKAGAKFTSLHDKWADTTTPHGELMVTILAGLGHVRASPDSLPHLGRSRACSATRREVWSASGAHTASEAGGPCPATGWRDAGRYRPELQRAWHHDRTTAGVVSTR